MDFDLTERQSFFRDRVRDFIEAHVRPRVADYYKQIAQGDRWQPIALFDELKPKAREAGLWNLFMPPGGALQHVDESFKFEGEQLTNLEYALCAEEMGRILWSAEAFNCSAPDTGNMEVLHRYGTRDQKEQWLAPLMRGEIRSAFLMTEPGVASSDATNIECRIDRDGESYVINGRKWWSSGAGDPRCKVAILMGKTDTEARKHQQQSMILMPLDAAGVTVERALTVYGYDDAPHGHMEISLKDVRVPAANLLLGEGRGFEIAQGRLGPGRIHHCMRTIGAAEEALGAMARRLQSRVAFGKRLAEHSVWEQRVAEARIEIDSTRLLCLLAADRMDKAGNKAAAAEIAMIKVKAPRMALQIIDDAIQAHGGAGVSQDFPLAASWAAIRTLRLADGPDEVHNRSIARIEFAKHAPADPGMSRLFDLTGKVAIVTGSSRGIGLAIAAALAEQGAKVVISSRKQDACDEVAHAINAEHGAGTAIAVAASISDKAALQNLVDETRRQFGRIDVLVCNAASNPYYGPMAGISDDQFRKILDNNVLANHWLISMAAPEMLERGEGSIIIISSVGGLTSSTTIGAYNISKAADFQLARNLAAEFGPKGVRVNCIAPGLIKTDFAKALWENPDTLKAVTRGTPLRRIGQPHEIAGAAVYLAAPASTFMTGQVMVVDGGSTIGIGL